MTGTLPISIIIMTRNEELHIRKCIESVAPANEIFVVDSRSTDRTVAIASELGAQVTPFEWNGKLPKKKNWCLINLPFKNEWALMVDADEEVPEAAWREIEQILKDEHAHAAYTVKFDYYFLGRRLRYCDPVRKLILFKHKCARFGNFDDAPNREVEGSEQPVIEGSTGLLQAAMIHNNLKGLHDYFDRHNAYSTRMAHFLLPKAAVQHGGGVQPKLFGTQTERREFFKQWLHGKPYVALVYFLYGYVVRLGFLDGSAGLYYNLCKAFYYFQIQLKSKELRDADARPAAPQHALSEASGGK